MDGYWTGLQGCSVVLSALCTINKKIKCKHYETLDILALDSILLWVSTFFFFFFARPEKNAMSSSQWLNITITKQFEKPMYTSRSDLNLNQQWYA